MVWQEPLRILLDTCAFVWLITDSSELSNTARDAGVDKRNHLYLSAVSVWEILTKHSSGKVLLSDDPRKTIADERDQLGISSLAFDEQSALHVIKLPMIHKDPFDRMLICQAIVHGLTILTPDEAIRRYPVRTLW